MEREPVENAGANRSRLLENPGREGTRGSCKFRIKCLLTATLFESLRKPVVSLHRLTDEEIKAQWLYLICPRGQSTF